MRDVNVIAIECMRELENIGIKCGNVIKIDVNTRSKKRWGQCRKIGNNYIIEVNQILLREDTDIDGLKNTIIHELLHTCKGCMKHTGEWKQLAEKVNRYYGYNIKRCDSADEKGISEEQKEKIQKERTATRKVKFIFKCTCCGQKVERCRESKFTKYPELYRCAVCHGKFERIF